MSVSSRQCFNLETSQIFNKFRCLVLQLHCGEQGVTLIRKILYSDYNLQLLTVLKV